MKSFTSILALMLVFGATMQHTPAWAQSSEIVSETAVQDKPLALNSEAFVSYADGSCDPCYPEAACAPCPPPCSPCNDPCAPVCRKNTGVSLWAIGLALLAVGGAAAIVVTSNNGSSTAVNS